MNWTVENKNILVTGGSSGIGQATAAELASRGANVTITSRDATRGAKAVSSILRTTGARVSVAVLDLADFASVRAFCEKYTSGTSQLAVLVNNAGGIFSSRRETVDGHEMTFATNHLGPFLLTSLLAETLLAAAQARVVNVSSVAHTSAKQGILFDDIAWTDHKYKMMDVYGHSKLANILHARGINDHYGPSVSAFALHPGIVATSFGGRGGSRLVRMVMKFGGRRLRSAAEGADTVVWLATAEHIGTSEGIYFADRAPESSTRFARDDEQMERLWTVSERLVSS